MSAKTAVKKSAFQRKAERVAEETGVELVDFFTGEKNDRDQFHDDETLHVHQGTERACFAVGGDNYSGKETNERTMLVMAGMGLSTDDPKKLKRVLVDEEPDEEESCPHCGRAY